MSDVTSKDDLVELVVDISDWIERAKADPVKYLERQATEVILVAMGRAPLSGEVYLKGGVLMGVAYESPRQTSDIDMTSTGSPEDVDLGGFEENLNRILKHTAREIGYLDIELRVQRIKERPALGLKKSKFPALEFSVGYCRRDDEASMRRLDQKNSSAAIPVDISFNEPVNSAQVLKLGNGDEAVLAYSLYDLMAEKLRAYLQQEIRRRSRRQDIYDLALLVRRFTFDEEELVAIHTSLVSKCKARDITPERNSISNPELARRAQQEWDSMRIELGNDLPTFQFCFDLVESFYFSLPWEMS